MEHTSVKITLLWSRRGAGMCEILMLLLVYNSAFVLLVFKYKLQYKLMLFNLLVLFMCLFHPHTVLLTLATVKINTKSDGHKICFIKFYFVS